MFFNTVSVKANFELLKLVKFPILAWLLQKFMISVEVKGLPKTISKMICHLLMYTKISKRKIHLMKIHDAVISFL